ncbi:thermonuclease family protein [Scytonema tolypothrichoides VB-61278]|nr:thermonuclease family protein [Scytonema tolypothrichoides VB-61278]
MPAHADITGQASVIDGDTIEVHGKRIRFHGIDAPENGQLCQLKGKNYRCGQKAALALDDLIARKTVRCVEKDQDRYQRIVGECFAGQVNLNAWMVENGWALAYRQYSTAYVPQEDTARARKVGIWAGTFDNPWDYRHGTTAAPKDSTVSSANNCSIKGNISTGGDRIYHVPGSRWYGRTTIDPLKGEKFFCSEAEAQNAGWRKAGHR